MSLSALCLVIIFYHQCKLAIGGYGTPVRVWGMFLKTGKF